MKTSPAAYSKRLIFDHSAIELPPLALALLKVALLQAFVLDTTSTLLAC
jgi:hypothetical protein